MIVHKALIDRAAWQMRELQFIVRYKREVVRRLLRRKWRAGTTKPSRSHDTRVATAERGLDPARIAVIYVYPIVGDPQHDEGAQRFVSTYKESPPLANHRLHVVFNGDPPTAEKLSLFDGLKCEFHQHDDTGWDVGAFQKAAQEIDCDMMVFLGGFSHFKRAGWLRRMADVFAQYGDGLYGASSSFERDPHVRSTGFWCHPMLVRAYPKNVRTYQDRYDFEASNVSITRLAERVRLGCWLVTWEGVYAKKNWRTPTNIFRRGDQSNALIYDRHFDLFEAMDDDARLLWTSLADGIEDSNNTNQTRAR